MTVAADLDRMVREGGCFALAVPAARKGSRTILIHRPKGVKGPGIVPDLLKQNPDYRKQYLDYLVKQASFNIVT